MPILFWKTPAPAPDDQSARMLAMIEKLELDDWQRDFMRDRWWDQIIWMDATARRCQWRHRANRMAIIISGVLAPALVSATFGVKLEIPTSVFGPIDLIRLGAIVAGLLVAICTATEELFRFGPRWRHYRQTSERVRSVGWLFMTLSGPYREYKTHAEAFQAFARTVEEAFQQDVDVYITTIFRENDRDRSDKPDAPSRLEPGH